MTSTDISGTPALHWEVEAGRPAALTMPEHDLDGTCEWLADHQQAIRQGLDLHGAVYLRGLPVRSVEDFARVRDVVVARRAAYQEKATPRSDFGDDVYSSTDFPASQAIRPHNENSYALRFPGVLVFCCLVAPERGGATPVTDVRRVLRAVPRPLAERFSTTGWALVRNYAEHISLDWRTAFGTEDPAQVERYCAENRIAHRWGADGRLRTIQRRSATIRHPRTGEEVWFNHLVFWNEWSLDPDVREVFVEDLGSDNLPFNTAFGDGEPVGRDDIRLLDDAYREATVRETWRPGDVLIVDNILAAHAREAFAGDRRVLVSMGDPVELADCAPTVPALAGFADPPRRRWHPRRNRGRL